MKLTEFLDNYQCWVLEYHNNYFDFEWGMCGDLTFYRMEHNTILDHKKFQKKQDEIIKEIYNINITKEEVYKKLHEAWKECNLYKP